MVTTKLNCPSSHLHQLLESHTTELWRGSRTLSRRPAYDVASSIRCSQNIWCSSLVQSRYSENEDPSTVTVTFESRLGQAVTDGISTHQEDLERTASTNHSTLHSKSLSRAIERQGDAAIARILRCQQSSLCSFHIFGDLRNEEAPMSPLTIPNWSFGGILRVGGRLANSRMEISRKRPIMLPKKSRYTKLFITKLHRTHLHSGPTTLFEILNWRSHVIEAKQLSRSITSECVVCKKAQAKTA